MLWIDRRVSRSLHPKILAEKPCVAFQRVVDLFLCPDVERSFPRFFRPFRTRAVSIFRGIKPSLRIRHIPQDIVQRLACHSRKKRVLRAARGIEVRLNELRLVVEHLFKMRDPPLTVHGITVEPPADLVVHPP